MDLFFLALTTCMLLFFGGLNWGKSEGAKEMRNKVVLYCIEKSDLCKEEYNNIKTQSKLNDYQKPEIEELK
jgi:hypothetical protein